MRPRRLTLAIAVQRAILIVLAGVFGVLGIGAVLGAWDFGLSSGAVVVGLLLVGDAALLTAAAVLSGRGWLIGDGFAIAVSLANAVASLADDVGQADAVTAAACVVAVVLIVVTAVGVRRASTGSSGKTPPPGP